MVDKRFVGDLRRNKPPGSRGRSNLYRFILEHWAELRDAGYGQSAGPTWQELTDRLTRHGQLNARGGPLQRLKVREMFLRVQTEVEARDVRRLTGIGGPQRLKAPSGSTPPSTGSSGIVRKADIPFAPVPDKPGGDQSRSTRPTPEELRAGLAEVIAKRSGR